MSADAPWATAPLKGVIVRWEAMVIRWGLEGDECSALLGTGEEGPVADISSYGLATAERRMRLLVTLEPIVASVHEADEERTRAWLRQPNVNLSNRTPLEVMTRSPEWILWLIRAMGVAA